jgi:FMN phosphatase YigB (HAD superfamily)
MASAFKKLNSWLVSVWDDGREITHLDQIQFLVRAASEGSVTIEEEWVDRLSSAYVSATFEVPPYINPDAHRVLRWLKDHNKLVGLICNVGLTPGFGLRKILAKGDVAKYFDLMIFSDEAGLRKPDPRIFRKAANELQLESYKIVHIGDNLRSDVWGAKNAGFKTVYLSTEVGRDRIAESDPKSLISISRKLGSSNRAQIVPEKTISSLGMAIEAIKELETGIEIRGN